MENFDFGTIKEAIKGLSDLIKQFVKVMTDFIDSWKQKIAIDTDGDGVEDFTVMG